MSQSQVIDVRPIPETQRHSLIFARLDALEMGQNLVVQNDHDLALLCGQVERLYGAQIEWRYLEATSNTFRLEFTRRATAPEDWNRAAPLVGTRSNTEPLPSTHSLSAPFVQLDLLEQLKRTTFSGPQWGHECEDLDLTLLSWEAGRRIEPHINTEVDVVWIGLEGMGMAFAVHERHELRPGVLLLIPKGATRGVEAKSERFSYLSVHKRRRGLMPTFAGKKPA